MEKQYYNSIISYLMNGTVGPGETDEEKAAIVKRASKYKVIGGVLYHKGKGRGIEDLRLVLTDAVDQENAIRTCHIAEASGRHFGRNKTSSLLAAKYYWRMMYTDVMQYVADCPTCSLDREVLERKSVRDRTKVWKLVEVEFLENFHTTRHYNFHLLKIVDVFSKWTRCFPVHNSSERNIVGTILEQFGSFGFPVAVRFVNCKTVTATLAALQKELELFIKRAEEVTPVLESAGVDVDGIQTCFRDMTVHVSVEEDSSENSLSDFASFEEYLRTFQRSRGDAHENSYTPVLHVLFGRESVVEEPIRLWLMEKIVYLKKQNPYSWASQMPFYMFCLQNAIPPTMNQSPFSIMFNRQPPVEPLWCWYGKMQNITVYDEPPPVSNKLKLSNAGVKKNEKRKSSSSLSNKKEAQKRPVAEEKSKTSVKKMRLDGENKKDSRSPLKGTNKDKAIRRESVHLSKPTKKDSSSAKKHAKGDSSFTPKLSEEGSVETAKLTDGKVLAKTFDGPVVNKRSRESKIPAKYSDGISSVFKNSKSSSVIAKPRKDGLLSEKTSKESPSRGKTSKDSSSVNKIAKNCTEPSKLKEKIVSPKHSVDAVENSIRDSLPKLPKLVVKTPPNEENQVLLPLDNSVPLSAEGKILRTLCQDQTQSALKKRFPGRPYKKNRKYVDMATEVPIHKPHDPNESVKSPPATPRPIRAASHEKCPKHKVNGDETTAVSSRYSFRQNLKPKGPSSYIQRFIAISSSKRTSTSDSELEVFGAHPLDPVEEIIYSSENDSVEDLAIPTEEGDALTVEKTPEQTELETLDELPLTNGVCDDDDALLYDTELCIDDGFLVLAEQDLQLQEQSNKSLFPETSKEGDVAVELEEIMQSSSEQVVVPSSGEEMSFPETATSLVDGLVQSSEPSFDRVLAESEEEEEHDLCTRPARVVMNRLSNFVIQRALEGPIQLRRVTNEGIVSLFMGDLKVDQFSLLQEKRVFGNSICKRVIQRRKYVEKKPFRCTKCSRTVLDSEEELNLHMRFHNDNVEGLVCPICKKLGSSWKLIFRHFFTHKDLMAEMEVDPEKYQKTCTMCQKVFATEDGLSKHVRLVHPPESDQFKCGECRMTFKDPKSFRRHQEIHDDITYQCGECGYTTKTHYNYILHAKFHESQRLDIAAKEGNSAKIMDVATVDENGLFGCQRCSFKTADDQELMRHVQTRHSSHRQQTFYCCDHCDKKFRSQAQLCSHILMHKSQSNDLFMCKLCPYKAKYKNVIHRHAKKQHPNFALKDVVQRPKTTGRVGRPAKAPQKVPPPEEEEEGTKEDPEEDIPTATVVVHTDENGELTVCEDEENDDASQIICVDSEGNFVLDNGGQTLQLLEGDDQQLILLEVDPHAMDGNS